MAKEEFWRHEHGELARENTVLKARVSRLQARIFELEEREISRSQSIKRTIDDDPIEEHNGRSTKRLRTEVDAVVFDERDTTLQRLIDHEAGSQLNELGESPFSQPDHMLLIRSGNNFLHRLQILQKLSIARKEKSSGPEPFARELRKFATDLCHHVSAIQHTARSQSVGLVTSSALTSPNPISKEQAAVYPRSEPGSTIEKRIIQIGRAFPHFLAHLHTLSELPESEVLCGKVISESIEIFRLLFQRICDLAVADAKPNQDTPMTRKKHNNDREKPDATYSFDKRPATSPSIMRICRLAISLMLSLDPAKPTHKKILEGCLYLLVTRVGRVLRDFTIGESQFGSVNKVATPDYDPYQEERQLNAPGEGSNTAASMVSDAQAPYLIWMLGHVPSFSSSMSPAPNGTATSLGDSRQFQPDDAYCTMYSDAHLQLQRTLVRAVFGEEVAASFQPALEPPDVLSDDDLVTDFEIPTETADVRDWFKNEVWRLVGWDVLRGRIVWD